MIASGVAIIKPSWRATVWLGSLWYGFHALNHSFEAGEARSEARGWGDTLALAFGALGAAWSARVAECLDRDGPTGAAR